MDKIRLELVGITYNQIESGVYAVILQEAGGTRRIPIIIGYAEAQAIECRLQEVVTPRPLTHDLMINIMGRFGIRLLEVNIDRLPNGVFAAGLLLSDGERTFTVDSRSSDGIALAIRVNAPIYTSRQLLEEVGFEPGERKRGAKGKSGEENASAPAAQRDTRARKRGGLEKETLESLYGKMQQAAENEDYEEASRIKKEIERRQNNDNEK